MMTVNQSRHGVLAYRVAHAICAAMICTATAASAAEVAHVTGAEFATRSSACANATARANQMPFDASRQTKNVGDCVCEVSSVSDTTGKDRYTCAVRVDIREK